ncbi:MAG: cyclic nucleotide-binding domain-containing protein [Anaerolineales bacterium]|nr:cyclic nucleotide-binding domain-containing protein [Anaerolineales bacterium]
MSLKIASPHGSSATFAGPCYNLSMLPQSPFELLRKMHFLRDIPEVDLQALAESLVPQEFEAGEIIIRQGSRANAMYFIAEGSVEVMIKHADRSTQIISALEAGDTFGEIEMVFRQARLATIRVRERLLVYRWDRLAMADFMKNHPQALSSLKFAAQSRKLAQKLRFDWLAEDEVIYGLARKHIALFYQALTLPLTLIAIAVVLIAWGLITTNTLIAWLGMGVAIPAVLLILWRRIDWGNDYYIVTNRRAVWLEKVIGVYDSRIEAPLHMVLSVSVSTEVVGRMLGYGDVIIRTFTGRVVFQNVENPRAMAAMVEEHWHRLRGKQELTDREGLREAVRKRLAPEPEPQQSAQPVPQESGPSDEPQQESRLPLFGFLVRFEDQDVITYRKHWVVLLREIGAPSFLIILTAGLFGAHLVGLMRLMPMSTFSILSVLGIIALSIWWLYRYVDWANDIYQVTPDQIVDVYKKPLSREVRKVAPLDNILSTEVDRKGLIGILFNYGDVIANVGTALFTFEGVFNPVAVQQDIVHAQEALLQRTREKERKLRQDEMVELLDIYHDEYVDKERFQPGEDESQDGSP